MEQYPELYRDILPGLDTKAPLSLFVNAVISSPEEGGTPDRRH